MGFISKDVILEANSYIFYVEALLWKYILQSTFSVFALFRTAEYNVGHHLDVIATVGHRRS